MTFGGGYAMLPILEREIVDKHSWATGEELLDYYAVGQCTPGIIAVNTATFIGRKNAGILGGIVATLGVVFPSVVIITVIAALLKNFADNECVKHAFSAVRVCVFVLILNSVIKLWKGSIKDVVSIILFAAVLILSFFFKLSPVIFVILCAVLGIVFTFTGVRGK